MRASSALNGYSQCVKQILKPVSTMQEAASLLARCKTRSLMVPSLQELIDSRAPRDNNKFLACVTEWQARHGMSAPLFKL